MKKEARAKYVVVSGLVVVLAFISGVGVGLAIAVGIVMR